jgi:hypothetical protein
MQLRAPPVKDLPIFLLKFDLMIFKDVVSMKSAETGAESLN